MSKIMKKLFELQQLEFEETIQPDSDERIAALRMKIPKPILAHYDRMCDNGKKGVALVRHQCCTGCHMQVPLGVVLDLKRGVEVCICGTCGRYLHLDEPTPRKRRTETATALDQKPVALIS